MVLLTTVGEWGHNSAFAHTNVASCLRTTVACNCGDVVATYGRSYRGGWRVVSYDYDARKRTHNLAIDG
jgi:hypothetical protein